MHGTIFGQEQSDQPRQGEAPDDAIPRGFDESNVPFPTPSSHINPSHPNLSQPNEIISPMSLQAAEIIPSMSPEADEIPPTISLDNRGHHIKEEVVNEAIVEDTLSPKRKKNTRGRRVRYCGQTCKSPFLDFCLSKYSRLTHSETTIADYIFDETKDPM